MKKKKIALGLMAGAMIFAPLQNPTFAEQKDVTVETSSVTSLSFPDIQDHWAKESIEFLVEQGVIDGFPDGTFGPDKNITREEAVKIMVSALGYEVKEQDSKFPDVADGHWAEAYINVAKDTGIIKGYPNGTFGLGDYLTRGEMASILVRAFDLKMVDEKESLPFPDVKDNYWAYNDILTLYQNGAVQGLPDGTFGAEKLITRAEFATFVERIMNKDQSPNKNKDGNKEIESFYFGFEPVIDVGQEEALKVIAKYKDGTEKDVTSESTFHMKDNSIATVKNGKLIGIKEGSTILYIQYGDYKAESIIQVVNPTEETPTSDEEVPIGTKKVIKDFVFTYIGNGYWEDEYGFISQSLPKFLGETSPSGKYGFSISKNPDFKEQSIYLKAMHFIIRVGLDITKEEFINSINTLMETKKPVTINNITFMKNPNANETENSFPVLIEVK